MRVLRAKDYLRMPWKNGGGETLEVAVEPPGASLESFAWRISMAHVASDGPFSKFPGIDRTLSVLSGQGLKLQVDQEPLVHLTPDSGPLAFSGDSDTRATLVEGPVTDLNIMSRRGLHRHTVQRSRLVGARELHPRCAITGIVVAEGSVEIAVGETVTLLEPLDTALISPSTDIAALKARGAAVVFLIEID